MIDPPSLEKDVLDNNRQNFLSLIDRVIFQKWHTEIALVINKEFSLTEVALIDSGTNMNCMKNNTSYNIKNNKQQYQPHYFHSN